MTDEQIIKALEWLSEKKGVCSSEDDYKYGEILEKFINRQKAEIERLERVVSIKQKNKQTIKSEAIKEFAERLKNEYADFDKLNEIIQIENLFLCIDDLVKEMTEQKGWGYDEMFLLWKTKNKPKHLL